jgi:hypothetical protein
MSRQGGLAVKGPEDRAGGGARAIGVKAGFDGKTDRTAEVAITP